MLDWTGCITRDAEAMAEVLGGHDLGTPVPSCPGWTLRELFAHLGAVHRWAALALGTPVEGPPPTEPEAPGELGGWFEDGAGRLVQHLRTLDPSQPCWGFGPKPRTAAFWARRQAHETALHRWDADAAVGALRPYNPELADDALDEALTVMFPRQVVLGRAEDPSEPVRIGRHELGEGRPVGWVDGPPDVLTLLVWGRTDLADPELQVGGDRVAVQELLDRALTP